MIQNENMPMNRAKSPIAPVNIETMQRMSANQYFVFFQHRTEATMPHTEETMYAYPATWNTSWSWS